VVTCSRVCRDCSFESRSSRRKLSRAAIHGRSSSLTLTLQIQEQYRTAVPEGRVDCAIQLAELSVGDSHGPDVGCFLRRAFAPIRPRSVPLTTGERIASTLAQRMLPHRRICWNAAGFTLSLILHLGRLHAAFFSHVMSTRRSRKSIKATCCAGDYSHFSKTSSTAFAQLGNGHSLDARGCPCCDGITTRRYLWEPLSGSATCFVA
jgi:hypothetical protein